MHNSSNLSEAPQRLDFSGVIFLLKQNMKILNRLRLSENKFKRRYEFCPSEGAIASRLVLGSAQSDSYFSFFYHYSIFLNSVFTRTAKYSKCVYGLLCFFLFK